MKKAVTIPEPRFTSTEGAAQFLNVSGRTIMRLRSTGQLRAVRIGASIKYAIRDLEAYAQSLLKDAE